MKRIFLPSLLVILFLLTITILPTETFSAPQRRLRTNAKWKTVRPTPVVGNKINNISSGVDVIPYIRGDRKAIFVDFEGSFSNVESIYYNLNYDSNENGTKRGIEGTIIPSPNQYSGTYSGNRYIRREYALGVCSKNICTYHSNPRNLKLTVKIKMKSGVVREDTKILEIQ